MKTKIDITSDLLFDALINAPVSDREWVEALVASASKHQKLHKAMHTVFQLDGLYVSPNKWEAIEEAAQRLNPKPPEFINRAYTSLVFICDNFSNAGKCIFANKEKEAIDWILSGKDTKRVAMPKKLSRRPKKPYGEGARLILNNFRERDDRTAWNKCK
jgi:hypothetical protein